MVQFLLVLIGALFASVAGWEKLFFSPSTEAETPQPEPPDTPFSFSPEDGQMIYSEKFGYTAIYVIKSEYCCPDNGEYRYWIRGYVWIRDFYPHSIVGYRYDEYSYPSRIPVTYRKMHEKGLGFVIGFTSDDLTDASQRSEEHYEENIARVVSSLHMLRNDLLIGQA